MNTYSLAHLADGVLLHDLSALLAQDRTTTAAVLAHIAEVDARKLYLAAGHPSMYSYCIHELRLSEHAALKRIHAARAARAFPALFVAVAAGRLHLSAVEMLGPHLTPKNADELVTAATHQTKAQVEQLLAEQFPRADLPTRLQAIASPGSPVPTTDLLPAPPVGSDQLAPGRVEPPAPQRFAQAVAPRPKVAPLSPERYALQLTISKTTHDKLRHAQALLSHQVPSGDLDKVLDRALDELIVQLEKRKFAATGKPRPGQRRPTGRRTIPAEVRRRVRERDGDQCTYLSAQGQRCPARTFLEFDHINEVARGGQATVSGIRLRCRAHNQYAAECTFGAGFMSRKRRAAAEKRAQAAASAEEARATAMKGVA